MRWHLKASEKIGKRDRNGHEMTRVEWVEQLQAEGHDTTGLMDEEPDLFPDLIQYWVAFHQLSSSRSSGMSIGPIPLPAHESYFRIMGVDSLEERLEYIHYVGVLDGEYLKWQGEKHEKESKKNKHNTPSKSQGHKTPALPPRR